MTLPCFEIEKLSMLYRQKKHVVRDAENFRLLCINKSSLRKICFAHILIEYLQGLLKVIIGNYFVAREVRDLIAKTFFIGLSALNMLGSNLN